MSREHVIDHRQAQHDSDPGAETEQTGLPPEVHARVRMMGPQHGAALGHMLRLHPQFATRILAIASPQMGMSATRRAISVAKQPEAQPESELGNDLMPLEEAASSTAPASAAPAASSGGLEAIDEAVEAPVMSERQLANARAYNRQHAHYIAQFNAATERKLLGPDGELDPIAVWHWQAEHGLACDGCVGPMSTAAAKREAKAAKAAEAHTETAQASPAHVEPAHAKPAHIEAAHAKPAHVEPAHVEPAHVEPAHAKPAHVEAAHAKPAHVEPAHVEPAHAKPAPVVEPAHVEPAHAKPAPVVEPAHVEPAHAKPAPVVEPAHAEPAHKKFSPIPDIAAVVNAAPAPAHVEPAHAKPAPVEPAHAEPAHKKFSPIPDIAAVVDAAPAPAHVEPAHAKPAPEATSSKPVQADAPATAPVAAPASDTQAGGSGETTTAAPVAPAPVVPVRPDNGGVGSQARRALAGGSAVEAFKLLSSSDDQALNANLADYGNVAEQRALLDAVIDQSGDPLLTKVAFHAYWHVQVDGLDARAATQSWPLPVLRSIHHQLKVLPDKDARAGAWKQLTFKNNGGQGRGWWGSGNFSITGNADGWDNNTWHEGYSVNLVAPAAAGATELHVSEANRFKVGEKLALHDKGGAREIVTISAISGDTYTLAAATTHAHGAQATLEPNNATAGRSVDWLDYTVRHEIAHSIDGKAVDGRGFYALGGWRQDNPLQLDKWVDEMGGASARQGNGISIPDEMPKGTPDEEDRGWFTLKIAFADAINKGARSLFTVKPSMLPYKDKGIPIIEAIERALAAHGSDDPTLRYASNGRRFSIDFDHRMLQSHNETMVNDRVTTYALHAPAEFFAETYAVFYEEAGKPGVTDADYGRLIRNSSQRSWMREHVHNRGQGPAGTGAVKHETGSHGGGEADVAVESGARNEGPTRGKKSSDSGL